MITTNKEYNEAREEARSFDAQRDKVEKEKRELQRQLQNIETSSETETSSAAFLQHDDRKRGDFYLDHVAYGGKVITDKKVLQDLLEKGANGTHFTIDNTLMRGDPWRLHCKSFTAVYAMGGKGPFKYLDKKEGEVAKFL